MNFYKYDKQILILNSRCQRTAVGIDNEGSLW